MRNIQKQLHPDKFSRASPYEQKLAADAATFINQAYATLHKHVGRFSYILSLHGFGEEDFSSGSVNGEFLNEIMDLGETLQEIVVFLKMPRLSEDALSGLRKSLKILIDRITESLNTERQALVDRLEQAKMEDAQISLIRYRSLTNGMLALDITTAQNQIGRCRDGKNLKRTRRVVHYMGYSQVTTVVPRMLRVVAAPCARQCGVVFAYIQAVSLKAQMNTVKLISNAPGRCSQWMQMQYGYCTVSPPVRLCWSCNRPVNNREYFCECGKIQPIDKNVSYFDAFGYVKPVVQIDTVDLARRMRNIQKQLHPDKFSRASPYEQKLAADAATFINQAYATLHKHVGRFSYILSLHGFGEEDFSSGSVNGEFLNEIMDLGETLQEIVVFLKMPRLSEDALSGLRKSLKILIDRITESLNTERQALVDRLEQAKMEDAQISLIRYRYYMRFLEQLSEHELAWKKLGIHIDIPSF
ncbi:hypothetical protein AHF37_01369 [Paragonimus kellicotti]|nr:hypothetical protein AHF37_01369 [Paragonimus kellicotti]